MAKWIELIELPKSPKRLTKTFFVQNKETKDNLGDVKWYGAFRGYSFFPLPNIVFEKTCLRDLADMLEQLNKEHKSKK